MRKREFQSFTLKLTDLTEYEAVREERAKKQTEQVLKSNESTPSLSFIQSMAKYGPKSKQEIRSRLGLKEWIRVTEEMW